jgi:hypothetical protein
MSNLDKNIIITPNVGATDDPKIVFSAANTTSNSANITMRAYPTSNGTLSFEGSAGQLFSITNQLTGTIFSVNDISGIPSIQVQDTGQIQLAPYNGNVVIGGVNSIQLAGNTTGNTPTISSTGTDTDINIAFNTKGAGRAIFYDSQVQSITANPFRLVLANNQYSSTAGQTSKIDFYQGAFGFGLSGGQMDYLSNGFHAFFGSGSKQFTVNSTGSAVNYLQVTGSTTGNSPTFSALGSNANVAINLVPKGNAAVMITGNTIGIIAAANSIYVGDRVGYANANNISVVYQSYNSSTNSLDVVFG